MFKFIVLLMLFKNIFGYNILITCDVPSPSHQIWNYALAKGLIAHGHNITLIGPDADKRTKSKNYHPLEFEGVTEEAHEDFDLSESLNLGTTEMMKLFYEFTFEACENTLKTKGFKQLMNYPDDFKFDLIIIDITLGPCLFPFIAKFKYPPTIGVTAFLLPSYISANFGNHLHPSYLPWYQLRYTDDMSFIERTWNFIFTHLDSLSKHYYENPEIEKLLKKYIGEHVDSVINLERHISIVLSNIDPILNYPQPLPPNIIPVGGLHTRPSKKLPEDLQYILDNSKNGVILFSLGTNLRSNQMDVKTRHMLLNAFSKLPYTVLWKFESEFNSNLPNNVIIRKWLPINDILGHSKTKLFISHGGALSTQEAMYHGIPVLGIPFYADQHVNIQMIVKRKLGEYLDFFEITTDVLLDKINMILTNSTYTSNMKDVSERFRDQPGTPLERAVFWAEYAANHDGAKFFNTKSRDLPFIVHSSLDVILFLVFPTSLFILTIYLAIKKLLGILFKRKMKKE